MINHITTNLVTKGLLNISKITNGMIQLKYQIILKKRGGSSANVVKSYDNDDSFYEELRTHNEKDIDCIKVYVDWKGASLKAFKKIEVKLLKEHIEAEILLKTNKKFTVEIIK